MVIVLARYQTRPEDAARVAAVLGRHAAQSEAEAGCLRFVVHQVVGDPTRFVLYEEYVDEAAFAAHRETEHFRSNIEHVVAPLLQHRCWERLTTLLPVPDR